MKKVIVIGCPGSGKSVFSRALHKITGLPLYHLDMIYWREDKTFLSREELIEKINEIGATDEWIIDGNYGGTMELRMSLCDTIIFLDYSTDVCLEGIMTRRGSQRPDIPWTDSDELDWILKQSDCAVLFYDELQVVGPSGINEEFRECLSPDRRSCVLV